MQFPFLREVNIRKTMFIALVYYSKGLRYRNHQKVSSKLILAYEMILIFHKLHYEYSYLN